MGWPWVDAIDYCAGLGLRLPSFSEGVTLATKYDVPGIGNNQDFWTGEQFYAGAYYANVVYETGNRGSTQIINPVPTVCVTDPSA